MPELALVSAVPTSVITCDHAGCSWRYEHQLDLTPRDAAAIVINRGGAVRHLLTHDEHFCAEHQAEARSPR